MSKETDEMLERAEELNELLDEIEEKTEELDLDDKLCQAEELNDLLDEIEEKLDALGGGQKHALTILTPDRKTILRCTHFSCMAQKDGRGVLNGGNSGHNMALAWYPDVASAQAELKNLFDALKNGVGFYEMK